MRHYQNLEMYGLEVIDQVLIFRAGLLMSNITEIIPFIGGIYGKNLVDLQRVGLMICMYLLEKNIIVLFYLLKDDGGNFKLRLYLWHPWKGIISC